MRPHKSVSIVSVFSVTCNVKRGFLRLFPTTITQLFAHSDRAIVFPIYYTSPWNMLHYSLKSGPPLPIYASKTHYYYSHLTWCSASRPMDFPRSQNHTRSLSWVWLWDTCTYMRCDTAQPIHNIATTSLRRRRDVTTSRDVASTSERRCYDLVYSLRKHQIIMLLYWVAK